MLVNLFCLSVFVFACFLIMVATFQVSCFFTIYICVCVCVRMVCVFGVGFNVFEKVTYSLQDCLFDPKYSNKSNIVKYTFKKIVPTLLNEGKKNMYIRILYVCMCVFRYITFYLHSTNLVNTFTSTA